MNCNVKIVAEGTADGLEVSIHGGSVGMMTAAELIVARVLMAVADDEKNLSDLKDSMFEIINEMVKLTDAVNGMNTNIKLTIQQLETTNRSLEVVTAQNKKQDDRLTALEKAPGVFGNKLWWAVIAAVIAGFVASELARYLH